MRARACACGSSSTSSCSSRVRQRQGWARPLLLAFERGRARACRMGREATASRREPERRGRTGALQQVHTTKQQTLSEHREHKKRHGSIQSHGALYAMERKGEVGALPSSP